MSKLLLVEDDASVRNMISTFLEMQGFVVDTAPGTASAFRKLAETPYSIVLSDIYLDSKTGLDVLNEARRINPECLVILMTGRGSMETVVSATRGGAFDYLAKPFDLDALLAVLQRAQHSLEGEDEVVEEDDLPESEMIGSSAPMIELYKLVSRVAPTDSTVLIEGETGTGKEVVARLIHRNSARSHMPLEAVDCGSVAGSLLESELFGAMRGAYTGAEKDRIGLLEAAHRGTVFLDEVGEIDAGFQLKLLRFLQEREVRPLGSQKARKVDVRVVAASNRSLSQQVKDGKFREDLFFRLNVVRLVLPPLRERKGDVALLAHFFLRKYNTAYNLNAKFHPTSMAMLESYSWPGNVRQLQHLVERLVILNEDGKIRPQLVEQSLQSTSTPFVDAAHSLADVETDQIRRVLEATKGNKAKAARLLGIERKTLYRKLAKLDA